MAETCNVCHERPARLRCIQCHKPVCDICAHKDANGAFCTRTCGARYAEFQRANRPVKPAGSPLLVKLVGLIVGLIALAVIVYLTGLHRMFLPKETADKIDKNVQQGVNAGKKAVDKATK